MCHFPNKGCIVYQLIARTSAQYFLPCSGHAMPYDYKESYTATMSQVSFLSHLAMFFHKCSFSLEETPFFRLYGGSIPLPSPSSRRSLLLDKSSIFIIPLSNNNPKVKERNDPFSLIGVLDRCEKQLFSNKKKRS